MIKGCDHVKTVYDNFWCENCDTVQSMNLPQSIKDVVKAGKTFTKEHKGCKKDATTKPKTNN